RLLRDDNTDVCRAAARALGGIGPEASSAIPVLVGSLGDRNRDVGQEARAALDRIDRQWAKSKATELFRAVWLNQSSLSRSPDAAGARRALDMLDAARSALPKD